MGGITRSRRDRMIGGVAGGLAERFDIDPLIVRAAFVVLAVAGGSGVLVYLLGWLLLPEEGQRDSIAGQTLGSRPWDGKRRRHAVIAILIVLAFWGVIRPWHWSFGRSVVAILAIAVIVLLGRRHEGPGSSPLGPTVRGPEAPWDAATTSDPTVADPTVADLMTSDPTITDPTSSFSSTAVHPTAWWAPSAPRQPSLVPALLAGIAVLIALSAGITATGWVSIPLAAVVTVALVMSLAALVAGALRGRFAGATLICVVFAVALAFERGCPSSAGGRSRAADVAPGQRRGDEAVLPPRQRRGHPRPDRHRHE